MAWKRYYKKRKYTKKEEEIDPLTALIAIVIFLFIWLYYKFIKPNIEEINNFISFIFPILILIILWCIWYWIYLKREDKKKETERINNIPNYLRELESKIKEFKPMRHYKEEKMYQAELVWFLKNNYPNAKIEETRHFSRPDIIIDDIAIEIKWPTNMSWLKTLPDKINSYLPKWDYLFIVLFNIHIVDDVDKNNEIYQQKKKEILDNTIESKRDKIFFIEI